MNGNKLLLDTNILIYLSKGDISLGDFAKGNDSLFISAITITKSIHPSDTIDLPAPSVDGD